MEQLTLIDKISKYTNISSSETTYLTHGIHPYPAKYIPQLPREIILANTNERSTILDPFCGSGTTLLEACINGRKSIGIDSNPIATLISTAKTHVLNEEELNEIQSIVAQLVKIDIKDIKQYEIPNAPNIDHWFKKSVMVELSWLKKYILSVKSNNLRNFLLCIFSSIIVNVSNQESDTRYAAKENNIEAGGVLSKFVRKLSGEYKNIKELSENKKASKNIPKIYNADSRNIDNSIIMDNSIDLVVTSPPYPNSYDYYLYHKWRMYWLGYDVEEVRKKEIGSRNEHSSRKAPISAFEEKMVPVLSNISRMLKPNKLAYFFIGDSIISGEFIDMNESFCKISSEAGLKYVAGTKYDLDSVTKYFYEKRTSSNKNKHQKMQHVLVFEPDRNKRIYISSNELAKGLQTNNTVYKGDSDEKNIKSDRELIAKPKSKYKGIVLGKEEIKNNSVVSLIDSGDNKAIHALGKYPSKFIPEIPRWAIEKYTKQGDTVMDPFSGSGTTAIEAILLGRNAIAVDISPYSCLLTEAKTTRLSKDIIREEANKLINMLEDPKGLPMVSRKTFEYDDFWFNLRYLEEIESIKEIIKTKIDSRLQRFFLAVLSTTIKPCSYLDEGQVKVKRDHKKLLNGTQSPIALMKKSILKYYNYLIDFNENLKTDVDKKVFNTSAENLNKLINENSVDLIVTSPPYINAMNYPMTHRYENILLDLIDPKESINYQTKYIGTERVYAKEYNKLWRIDDSLKVANYLNPKLEQIFEKEPKRSYICYKYFTEMNNSFSNFYKILKEGGQLVLVVGTNKIRGIEIDTFKVLVLMLEDLGMKNELTFHYEIIKNALKIKRHNSSDIIKFDGVAVLRKGE